MKFRLSKVCREVVSPVGTEVILEIAILRTDVVCFQELPSINKGRRDGCYWITWDRRRASVSFGVSPMKAVIRRLPP